ncbi:MAG TPA: response regulator [Clostridia bacterium]|nr:response regulator [Clostridia bacterium]
MKRILLADDEELERLYLSNFFLEYQDRFIVVGQASNGLEAVRLAGELLPDIIFMDIKMPGLNGLEATERIKKIHPNCAVIIVSAYDDFAYIRGALQLKVEDYLLKPVSPEEILALLDKIQVKSKPEKDIRHQFYHPPEPVQNDYILGRYSFENERTIVHAIQLNDLKSYLQVFSTFCDDLISSNISLDVIKVRLGELNILIGRTFLYSGYDTREVYDLSLDTIKLVNQVETKEELSHSLDHLKERIRDFLEKGPDTEDITENLTSFLKANYASNLPLQEVAKKFYFSSSHLSKMLKKKTGLSYTEYLNNLRIAQARFLLKNSSHDINTIARMVGYNSISHFNRIFKKIVGISPTQYKRLVLGEAVN